MYSLDAVNKSPNLAVYDSLDAEVTQSYLEFSLASMLYYAMKEGACSEQSSRMTAMDNASKNAGQSPGDSEREETRTGDRAGAGH